MSAYTRKGQRKISFQNRRARTPRGLNARAACVEVYVRLPAYVPLRTVPNAEVKGEVPPDSFHSWERKGPT